MENKDPINTQPVQSPVQGPSSVPVSPVNEAQAQPIPGTNMTPSGMTTPPSSGDLQKKGPNKILLILIVVILIVVLGGVGVYLFGNGILNPTPAATTVVPTPTVVTPSPTPEGIETGQDLQDTLEDLNQQDPDLLQEELDQNNLDASGFSN